jgi:two-component system alkaline phosphatase synthesis response regulator PhoP
MRVLAVADELGVLRLIEAACQEAGMACVGVSSAAEGISCLREWGPGYFAVALLDAAMLVLTGVEYCRRLRQLDPDLELIFLINPDMPGELDQVLAVDADDYIAKPLSAGRLVAKLKFLRRRHQRPHAVEIGVLRFDFVEHAVFVEGKRRDLTERESSILLHLALQHGEPVSKAELLERIWHHRSTRGSNRVEVHIASLRRKIGPNGVNIIRTVWRKGYSVPVVDERKRNRGPEP